MNGIIPVSQKQKSKPLTQSMEAIPPHDKEIEQVVLGSLMLESKSVEVARLLLHQDTFYFPSHQLIYEAIIQLHEQNEAIDILTVTKELQKMGKLEIVGGGSFITQLTSRIASSANIETHIAILTEKFIKRSALNICYNAIREAYDESSDAFEVLGMVETEIEKILYHTGNGNSMERISTIALKAYDELKIRDENFKKGIPIGIDTGLQELNKLTGGWQRSDLIILAARPGMGKSAMMLHFAQSAAINGSNVCIFSLEMSSTGLCSRLTSSLSNISVEHYLRGGMTEFDWMEFNTASTKLSNLPIFIDQLANQTLSHIRAQCRLMKNKSKCDIVMIDYLQLIENQSNKSNQNREQDVAELSRKAKLLAKELDIPVILLSQLSRKVEERNKRKPILSDLRESGAIEQDADLVLFIYRPEMYDYTEMENGESTSGIGEIIIGKNRMGPTATAQFRYNQELTKIFDY